MTKSHEQMREALRLANKSLKRWMPISWDRQAMDEYHQAISASEQALATEPEPLVRLTEEEIAHEYSKADAYLMMTDHYEFGLVANAIMDAMERVNGGLR